MLLHLHVKNFALIRETEIDFSEGLNILTGETGAGKSILIGSITVALGGKVAKEMLRSEEEPALVELIFSVDQPGLLKKLQELEIPMEDGQLILSRRVSGSRSICRLNGVTVASSVLKEISSWLIDIHGQHEHQSLLHKKKHLEILDAYAHEKLSPVLAGVKDCYEICQSRKKELEESLADESARVREQSLLEFELQEIEEADLKEGEDEQLEESYQRMVNGRKILEALTVVKNLCGGEEVSASEQLGRACRELSGVIRYDGALESLNEQMQAIDSQLQDAVRELEDYMEGMEFSGQELAETEERLNQINHLKAKYGQTIPEIRAYQTEKQERLDRLVNYEQYKKKLQEEYEKASDELKGHCIKAHDIRSWAALELTRKMQEQLEELNFLDVQFEISVTGTKTPTALGLDDVEFLISTNPGEPLKPLGKIASGGELSRVMLAIKTVMADQDEIHTVIFDEIDAGISGRTAQKVSEKLALIGRSRQVICITHLAQLASMADGHYCIEKEAVDGITRTRIRRLFGDEITEELARILGGAKITDAVRWNAMEMRRLALEFKKNRKTGKT